MDYLIFAWEYAPNAAVSTRRAQEHSNCKFLYISKTSMNKEVTDCYEYRYDTVDVHYLFGGVCGLGYSDGLIWLHQCRGKIHLRFKFGPAPVSSRHATICSALLWCLSIPYAICSSTEERGDFMWLLVEYNIDYVWNVWWRVPNFLWTKCSSMLCRYYSHWADLQVHRILCLRRWRFSEDCYLFSVVNIIWRTVWISEGLHPSALRL